MSYAQQALDYLRQYPEIIAVVLGTLASWSAATILELYFVPPTWPDRKAKQLTIIANIVVGTLVSFIVWATLDPKDPRLFNFTVSFTCALISPFSYVWVAKVLTHFVPWIGSVWGTQPATVQPPAATGVKP